MAGRPAALSAETSLATALMCMASWLLFAAVAAYGLSLTSNINADGAYVTTGGIYSGTDGMWAEWNASFIMHYGQFLDPSPFNAFAGMGSMFLPNLPWLNPGALMLAAPFGQHDAYLLSYLAYMVEVGAALTILARSIGFSWAIATIAAELHILVLFPPFSAYFMPLEWYSAAPVYAHLTAVWCFALTVFMACGRKGGSIDILAAAGFGILVLAGILSAPFSFIFFSVPFATLGLALICARPPSPRELAWKAGAIAGLLLTAHFAGFTDYLLGTVATSARTPVGPANWSLLLSPAAWFERVLGHSICSTDPRGLMCLDYPLWWLQALALAGGAYLALAARGGPRAAGVWGILFLGGMHLYAYAYQSGTLGPIGTLSTHFLSWSAHAVLPVVAVAAICLAARAFTRIVRDGQISLPMLAIWILLGMLAFWGPWRAIRESGGVSLRELNFAAVFRTGTAFALWGAIALVLVTAAGKIHPVLTNIVRSLADSPLPPALPFATLLALLAVPAAAGYITVAHVAPGRPDPVRQGPITDTIARQARLGLDEPFRGYAATFWSPALNVVDESGMAARSPVFRYIHARTYFVARYGTTFTEVDLWRAGIPTFEEYGQWVSRQSQILAKGLLAEPGVPYDFPTFLRIYKLDIDIMRALGIRFLITDLAIDDDPRLVFRMKESAPDAFPVYLYEIERPNLATYSPIRAIRVEMHAEAILSRMGDAAKQLDELVFVRDPLQGPFTPARRSSMTLKRDGYRVSAEADGLSLLLLPVQFSHCLTLADHAGGDSRPRLFRANLAQTGVLFRDRLDATIEFDFGLFGNGSCRLKDGRDVAAMTAPPS